MSTFGSYERCSTCGEYGWVKTHKCPPRFLVWCPEYGEDAEDGDVIYARDHELAAERWAERSDADSAEYSIVSGTPVTVHVVTEDGDPANAQRFFIEGESQPVYHAYPAKD